MKYIPKAGEGVIVKGIVPDSSDSEIGVRQGMYGVVQDGDPDMPWVYFPALDLKHPMYPSQLRKAKATDLQKPQPVLAVTINEGDVLAILTKYVKDEIGIDAEVSEVKSAFEGALTLVLKDAA